MTRKVRSLSLKPNFGAFRRAAWLALPLALLSFSAQPILAQSVEDQLQRLQRELSDLQRQVYTDGAPPPAAASGGVAPTQAARIQLQLDQFESQLADLTGRIEDMGFRIQSVTDRLDKLVADVDLRLRNLEQGGVPPLGTMEDGAPMVEQDGPVAAARQTAPAAPRQPGTIGTISENDLSSFQQSGASAAAPPPAAGQQSAALPAAGATLPGGSPQEQYDYAFGLLRQANYAGAEQAFTSFLAEHPQDALAGNAKYWLGETYYVRGNYQQAAVTFAEGFEAYPNNSKAPDNLLKLGMSLASLGSTTDACGTFSVLLDRYRDAPATILSRAQRESQRLGCN